MQNQDNQYGFYDRLKAEFPSQVIVDITEVCNLACIHCPHSQFEKSPHYAARYLEPALNNKLVDEIKQFGQGFTEYIRYSSEGEPLLHRKCYEMIEYAVVNSGVFVTLTTNGTILNETGLKKLFDAGIHMIDISIDAIKPETYARIRVNGKLEVTNSNVMRMIEMNKKSGGATKIVVSFVRQPANDEEADEFQSFWEKQGADYVVIRKLHSAAGTMSNVAHELRDANSPKNRRPCLYPWERIILNPRGHLAFCPADWEHKASIADFRHTTIREVWQGSFYQELRKAHMVSNFSTQTFCGQCPDWERTCWPGQGRSYANMIAEFKEGR